MGVDTEVCCWIPERARVGGFLTFTVLKNPGGILLYLFLPPAEFWVKGGWMGELKSALRVKNIPDNIEFLKNKMNLRCFCFHFRSNKSHFTKKTENYKFVNFAYKKIIP